MSSGEALSKKYMEAVDKLYLDPSERATRVLNLIKEHMDETEWDLFCFCVEYVGMKALGIGNDDLLAISVELSRWLYSAHYSNPRRLYGDPDRGESGERASGGGRLHRLPDVPTSADGEADADLLPRGEGILSNRDELGQSGPDGEEGDT